MMVCDSASKSITVFSKDLKQVRKIGCGPGQFGHPRDVCSDEEGHLYVSDGVSQCVHVFSNGGEFLHSFGQGKLEYPVGVCVTGQHMCVADRLGNCVCVFTTEGEHVTSFGQCGVRMRVTLIALECAWTSMALCMSVIMATIEFKSFDVLFCTNK